MSVSNPGYAGAWFIFLAFALAPVSFADPPEGWAFLSYDEASEIALEQDKRMFVYFGRYGCPTCERVNRESFVDDRVDAKYKNNYVLAYVDSESGERLRLPTGERVTEMELGIRHDVVGTPTFFFMEPDGTTILKIAGYVSAGQLLGLDLFVDGEHYKTRTLAEFVADES